LNLQDYLEQREKLEKSSQKYRTLCVTCLQPEFGCYCHLVKEFDPHMKVVILIHPIEVKRRIATGRMSHLMLANSHLIKGQDFTENEELNSILQSPIYQSVVLYPGSLSLNLSDLKPSEQNLIFSPEKQLALIVIDGTWATAGRMIRQSKNLIDLPRVCFTPTGASRFRVRKQPAPQCLSTIEAIHQTIEVLRPVLRLSQDYNEHDRLLDVFDSMVERQLNCIRDSFDNPRPNAYRRPKVRIA